VTEAPVAGLGLPVATSADGTRVLADGPVVLGPDGSATSWPGGRWGLAAGFLGDDEIVYNRGRRVLIGHPDGGTTPVPAISDAVATAPGRGLVIASSDDGDERGVFDVRTGRQLLSAGDDHLLGFSPDGEHVVGIEPRGLAVAEVATGRIVVLVAGLFVDQGAFAWEDPDHLLLVVEPTRAVRYVVRVDLAGEMEMEMATGPSSGDHDDNYVLPAPRG
jgi:hypothetical protein